MTLAPPAGAARVGRGAVPVRRAARCATGALTVSDAASVPGVCVYGSRGTSNLRIREGPPRRLAEKGRDGEITTSWMDQVAIGRCPWPRRSGALLV